MNNPFSPPDIWTARRILAIQPHYDDNDIAAGGTLAALAAAGAELIYLTVTDDLVGVVDQDQTDEAMAAALKDDQRRAAEIIGGREQHWLGYPDAGDFDYFDLRRQLIRHIRMLRPDFIITVDPWMPYEAHNDHIVTGRAAAEAAILFGLPRLKTDPAIDAAFEPFDLLGIAFYGTAYPNTVMDISAVWEQKREAVRQYRAQFTEEEMEGLLRILEFKSREFAAGQTFTYGEPLKILRTLHLHGYPQAIAV
jgi:LmbE family N-acetylglucosaminyl deacetylase